MLFFVPRTCSIREEDPSQNVTKAIDHFRELNAYVLLGDPGAGKSRLFAEEATAENGICIPARDFIDYDREEWRGKTLFIDGLDETRAGRDDAHTPLGAIRGKLDKMGCPRFRLSCRAADWLGNSDAEALKSCTPDGKITQLYLEPLDHAQVVEILTHDERVQDAEDFLNKASQFNLKGLLYNPQTLDMLISAVDGAQWPTTKLGVYELACEKLAIDPKVPRSPHTIPQLLDAAGCLFAIQLLSNMSGIHRGHVDKGRLGLSNLEVENIQVCQAVLGTRLFTSVGDDEYSYVHRSVAEFLGARYISGRIKQGLPVNRILALSTGFDGGVMAALRGLMAWLGALNGEACGRLIEVDALGMVLYGDAQLFSVETKLRLLDALKREAERTGHISPYWNAHGFAALATQDMVPHLIAMLASPSRERPEQNLLLCMLEGLCSTKVSGLGDALMAVVRDPTQWEDVRVDALGAFMHQYPEKCECLVSLADELRQNKIEGYSHRLLGLLLYQLFPQYISPNRVLQYLQPNVDDERTINRYDTFWSDALPKRLSDEDVPAMLDGLSEVKPSRQQRGYRDWYAQHLAESLLIRGLRTHGDGIAYERLYRWLSIGMDEHDYSHLGKATQQEIGAWLGAHPDCYLKLLEVGVSSISDPKDVRIQIYRVFHHLYQAKPPASLGVWWLEQSLIAHEKILQDEFFSQAFWLLLHEGDVYSDLSLETFERFVEQHSEFEEIYRAISKCDLASQDWRLEFAAQDKEFAKEREDELKARIDYFHQHKTTIADGSAYAQTYHHLASVWFDHYTGVNGKTGEERLADFLNDDQELISAAKSGLQKILERTDLPEVEEIFSLALKQREHFIRLPFLTCMEKRYQETPAMLSALDDALAEKALAFWYTYGAGNEPDWVKQLSVLRPALAAKVLTAYVRIMLAGKVQHITGLYQLAHDPDYRDIARVVALPLLETHPVRGTQQQASHLEYLLKAAIATSDKADLLSLVAKKLALKGLDVTQRVYWLVTGLIVSPEMYEPVVRKEISGKLARINHLSAFLHSDWGGGRDVDYPLPSSSMGLLIELLGPRCTPDRPTGAHWVTRADNERDYVGVLLNKLGGMPDEASGKVLASLLAMPKLAVWHDAIRTAWQTQQVSYREATFRHPAIHDVVRVLNNSKPANVADLAALAMDFLEKLSVEMHASNTDSYTRCWNVDAYGKPVSPRPENDCRNYVAEKLRPLFAPLDVDVQPETREAESRRADMRLSFRSDGRAYHLPIEVKLDHSPDLWRAIHEQLIPLYTIAPETEGRGVLLVIWFNDPNKRSSAPPSGTKPKTAAELVVRLRDTLTQQEQKLIDVFVLDVSKHSI